MSIKACLGALIFSIAHAVARGNFQFKKTRAFFERNYLPVYIAVQLIWNLDKIYIYYYYRYV